jgi:hypothetical protein
MNEKNSSLRPMLRTATRSLMVASILGGVGLMGGGCLSRPVTHQEPTTKTNFTAVVRQSSIDKIDLLFAIDNSASMGDKQALFAAAVPDLITRLVTPNCVDTSGAPKSVSAGGKCPEGTKIEFPPVHDMHIGVVSSSLGGRASDACPTSLMNPTNPALNAHNDDSGHLLNRGGNDEHTVSDAKAANFLAWLPPASVAPANMGKPAPPVPALSDPTVLVNDFKDMVVGTHEHGCGYEAQLESWYRFLIQPDPYATIKKNGDVAALDGVDGDILKQRHDFLRPDSLVAIIVLTDENHSTVDPLSFGGKAWYYEQGAHVKPGTQICATNPNDPKCQSCYLVGTGADPGCNVAFDDKTDGINDRFYKPKERFGYDMRFPISRYVQGLSARSVPDRNGEHPPGNGFNYVGKANCSNPLFSTNLPTSPTADLCHLTPGPRTPDLVFYGIIGGVPWQLLTEDPTNMTAGNKAPFKSSLSVDDWTRILGKDPANYDTTGIDPHMLESAAPRAGVGPDEVHTAEWTPTSSDLRLQFACTFKLPAPKDCTKPEFNGACDCQDPTTTSPLCDATVKTTQNLGKAYPTIQELQVANKLGDQAIVASLCPREPSDTTNADYGYRPAVRAIVDRLKNALANQCLPAPLTPDETGNVPCLILETLAPTPGLNQGNACDPAHGLTQPDPAVLAKFIEGQAAAAGGDAGEQMGPVCQVAQLTMKDFVNGTCGDPLVTKAGWCYLTGAATGGTCPQAIKFSTLGNPGVGAKVSLQCIEQSATPSAGDGG